MRKATDKMIESAESFVRYFQLDRGPDYNNFTETHKFLSRAIPLYNDIINNRATNRVREFKDMAYEQLHAEAHHENGDYKAAHDFYENAFGIRLYANGQRRELDTPDMGHEDMIDEYEMRESYESSSDRMDRYEEESHLGSPEFYLNQAKKGEW